MVKQFNQQKTYYFVLLPSVQYRQDTSYDGKIRDNFGQVSFRTYTDRAGALGRGTGQGVQYVVSKDDRGRDRGKNFTISQAHNALLVREADRDIYGTLMLDFIKNYPECEGSPNGDYITDADGNQIQLNVKFRLMNDDADAEVALQATLNRSKAQLSVLELDGQTLMEVAAIGLGMHGQPTDIMRFKVSEWAGKRPIDYFNILDSGDRLLRAIIRKAVNDGILTVRGELVYWGNQLLGSSEDNAIKFLMENKDTYDALMERVEFKAKVVEKRKAGRPPKNQKESEQ